MSSTDMGRGRRTVGKGGGAKSTREEVDGRSPVGGGAKECRWERRVEVKLGEERE